MQAYWNRKTQFSMLLIGMIAAVELGAGMWTHLGTSPPARPFEPRPECPQHDVVLTYRSETGLTSITEVPLSGPITNIAEFHDCQRLLVREGVYGPLVAIFASFRLDSLLMGRMSQTVGVPAATLYSYDGNYDNLGVKQGFNCLYVFHDGSLSWPPLERRGEGWVPPLIAKMVPRPTENCPAVSYRDDPAMPGTSLQVRRPGGDQQYGITDYPPVARWEWEGRTQFIGIKCGNAWCEIGRAGFNPRPVTVDLKWSQSARRPFAIKGWHDEDPLAVASAASPNDLVPGRVTGRVVPVDNLESYNGNPNDPLQPFNGNWVLAARVYLDGSEPIYRDKYGYVATTDTTANKVYLCSGSNCRGLPPNLPATRSCTTADKEQAKASQANPTHPVERWYAKVESAGSTGFVRYLCVTRRGHEGLPIPRIPGTARWRWVASDQTIWIRCLFGCCQIY